jgi:formate--tetrahydrofolate ligase
MAKTPAYITGDPSIKGAPRGFTLDITELKLYADASFISAVCGNIMTMPGLSDRPSYMNLDIDQNGDVIGLS